MITRARKVRHLLAAVGSAACGHPLDGGHREHVATTAVGLLQALDSDGPVGVCRPCALYAAERVEEDRPELLPEWSRNATTLVDRLKGSYGDTTV